MMSNADGKWPGRASEGVGAASAWGKEDERADP